MSDVMLANFREEQSAKIPALTVLSNLGYEFIPPGDCLAQRGNLATVILPQVLRDLLAKKTFSFMGKAHPLSAAAIDKIGLSANFVLKLILPPPLVHQGIDRILACPEKAAGRTFLRLKYHSSVA